MKNLLIRNIYLHNQLTDHSRIKENILENIVQQLQDCKNIIMTSEGDLTKKLEIKMEMLGLIKNDIPKVLHRNKMKELEKTATLIENKLDKFQELK